MSKLLTRAPQRFRARARTIFAATLVVISAIAAFAVAGESGTPGNAALLGVAPESCAWCGSAPSYTNPRVPKVIHDGTTSPH
jgi:hypothetical protein